MLAWIAARGGAVSNRRRPARRLDFGFAVPGSTDLEAVPFRVIKRSRLALNQQWRRLMQDDLAMSNGLQQLGVATTRDPDFGRKVFPDEKT